MNTLPSAPRAIPPFPKETVDRARPGAPPARARAVAALQSWLRESLRRQRTLTLFGLLLLALMVPALVALGLDDRTLRGVNVWVKPLKFFASVALFSLTTAWFAGLVAEPQRRGRVMRATVAVLVTTASFELGYITLQAARGEASHYNVGSAVHLALYVAMGGAALALTATQAVLGWLVARHPRPGVDPVWRQAAAWALWLTFVLGAGAGMLLGSMQPPSGAGLPVVGWHLGGGDLRPAHFLGIHAQQLVPLAGLLALHVSPRPAQRRVLAAGIAALVLLWAAAMALGLSGGALPVR